MKETAIIIGAGPAGLTAAYELVTRTNIKPIVLEQSNKIGGISRTEVYKGNRIDIGGHRFFSKSKVVMDWWQHILPIQGQPSKDEKDIQDANLQKQIAQKLSENGPNPEKTDRVMLIRSRLSRIFFMRKFFNYPISLNWNTIASLGFFKIVKIGWTYMLIQIFPPKNIDSLEDFLISRFGKELYETFFKDYTEKVWGVPCSKISSEWGAQRIKGLSVTKTILHAIKAIFVKDKSISQESTETSLIEQFMYPKLGPGQLWETVTKIIIDKGGEVVFNAKVIGLKTENNKITEVSYTNNTTKTKEILNGNYVFSSMPVKHLIKSFGSIVPPNVKDVGQGLLYRDFITVGLLLNELKITDKNKKLISDNWIYIQESDVKLGRLQIFNNWSPYLVKEDDKVWIGLEYFCNKGDDLWEMDDDKFIEFAIEELHKIDIIHKDAVLDSTIIKVPKAYPAYFGTYDRFDEIKTFTDTFKNLFLIGRNGMHKYNNQDHSMLTAITSVNNILSGITTKDNIWSINVEKDYHEEK
ncbi:NAD(P)/FAD-dependent oxidoreductase [Pontimicrobium aquaticum]|uniref:NAD(P)/FAD-dependent oxidoreductase n=1 Tax=Pontimicrobium aquaticum TaxID=2565367 RepID=UPI001B7FAA44|nr:NAD(P)/FAD-dependent oxidoreductase [Pontimicrobium aquaticum]